jgi:hypothetical protein
MGAFFLRAAAERASERPSTCAFVRAAARGTHVEWVNAEVIHHEARSIRGLAGRARGYLRFASPAERARIGQRAADAAVPRTDPADAEPVAFPVSDSFPVALALASSITIAFSFAVGTAVGGLVAPTLFAVLVQTGCCAHNPDRDCCPAYGTAFGDVDSVQFFASHLGQRTSTERPQGARRRAESPSRLPRRAGATPWPRRRSTAPTTARDAAPSLRTGSRTRPRGAPRRSCRARAGSPRSRRAARTRGSTRARGA